TVPPVVRPDAAASPAQASDCERFPSREARFECRWLPFPPARPALSFREGLAPEDLQTVRSPVARRLLPLRFPLPEKDWPAHRLDQPPLPLPPCPSALSPVAPVLPCLEPHPECAWPPRRPP